MSAVQSDRRWRDEEKAARSQKKANQATERDARNTSIAPDLTHIPDASDTSNIVSDASDL